MFIEISFYVYWKYFIRFWSFVIKSCRSYQIFACIIRILNMIISIYFFIKQNFEFYWLLKKVVKVSFDFPTVSFYGLCLSWEKYNRLTALFVIIMLLIIQKWKSNFIEASKKKGSEMEMVRIVLYSDYQNVICLLTTTVIYQT